MTVNVTGAVQRFLAQPRVTVVGASDAKDNFGGTLYRTLKGHGHAVTPVNPKADTADGDRCYPDLASVPGPLGGVLVAVKGDTAVEIVRSCVELDVKHIWLFKGLGGKGAASVEALALCEAAGLDVVPGACPMMFLEPVSIGHRIHRRLRRLNGSLPRGAAAVSFQPEVSERTKVLPSEASGPWVPRPPGRIIRADPTS